MFNTSRSVYHLSKCCVSYASIMNNKQTNKQIISQLRYTYSGSKINNKFIEVIKNLIFNLDDFIIRYIYIYLLNLFFDRPYFYFLDICSEIIFIMSNKLPEFEPSIDQMNDFSSFISDVEASGAHKLGYVLVRPPQEWKDQFPSYETQLTLSYSVQSLYQQSISQQPCGLYTLHSEWLLDEKNRKKKMPYLEFRSIAISKEPSADDKSDIEKAFWKDISRMDVLYGPDCDDSFFRLEVSRWNLNFLGKLNS